MRSFKKLCALLFLVGCAHESKSPNQTIEKEAVGAKRSEWSVDYGTLERALGLDRSSSELGFLEKKFNSCQNIVGYPNTGSCDNKILVAIRFRLLCRDSEGTTSQILRDEDLQPLSGQQLTWFLKGLQGQVQMDSEGYGKILTVSPISQRTERLRISNSEDFLLLRAGEIRRLIVPANWCTKR